MSASSPFIAYLSPTTHKTDGHTCSFVKDSCWSQDTSIFCVCLNALPMWETIHSDVHSVLYSHLRTEQRHPAYISLSGHVETMLFSEFVSSHAVSKLWISQLLWLDPQVKSPLLVHFSRVTSAGSDDVSDWVPCSKAGLALMTFVASRGHV